MPGSGFGGMHVQSNRIAFLLNLSTMSFLRVHRATATHVLTAMLGTFGILLSTLTFAEDISRGKAKAQSCATCHGVNGIAQMPNTPHLAGQPATYLAEQLKSYRAGKRRHEVMNVIAKPLTDQEISDLAAWYASLQIEVKS